MQGTFNNGSDLESVVQEQTIQEVLFGPNLYPRPHLPCVIYYMGFAYVAEGPLGPLRLLCAATAN